LNRRGFTLVESLIAATMLITAISMFTYVIRSAKFYGRATTELSARFNSARQVMEEAKRVGFTDLPSLSNSQILVQPLSADLFLLQTTGTVKLYTLRSKY